MEWISVEDELPPANKLVFCYGFTGENEYDLSEKDYDIGYLILLGGTDPCMHMHGYDNGHVTHWMMPKPPTKKPD